MLKKLEDDVVSVNASSPRYFTFEPDPWRSIHTCTVWKYTGAESAVVDSFRAFGYNQGTR